ncbi:MAG TPA: FAD-binding oxidoreductase, partial [Urbifossiella sp.]|nr:FAD-binding oxidoreductase [Urbifossiella sp.]
MTTATLPTPAGPARPAVSQAALVARMRAAVGADNVLTAAADLAVYECDGFTIEKNRPEVVVFPTTTEQIVGIVKACGELGLPFL